MKILQLRPNKRSQLLLRNPFRILVLPKIATQRRRMKQVKTVQVHQEYLLGKLISNPRRLQRNQQLKSASPTQMWIG
jgi:hypothetical protein